MTPILESFETITDGARILLQEGFIPGVSIMESSDMSRIPPYFPSPTSWLRLSLCWWNPGTTAKVIRYSLRISHWNSRTTRHTIRSMLLSKAMTGPCMRRNSGSILEIWQTDCANISRLQSLGCSLLQPGLSPINAHKIASNSTFEISSRSNRSPNRAFS